MAKGKVKSAEPTPPPLVLDTTKRFDKDVKRQEKPGKSLDKLHAIIEALRNRRPLDPKHKDHPLGGDRKGWRDCHIEPDWVLIYQEDDVTLTLGRLYGLISIIHDICHHLPLIDGNLKLIVLARLQMLPRTNHDTRRKSQYHECIFL